MPGRSQIYNDDAPMGRVAAERLFVEPAVGECMRLASAAQLATDIRALGVPVFSAEKMFAPFMTLVEVGPHTRHTGARRQSRYLFTR